MVRNGKNNTNPTGSSHAEQLQPKRLTLILIIKSSHAATDYEGVARAVESPISQHLEADAVTETTI